MVSWHVPTAKEKEFQRALEIKNEYERALSLRPWFILSFLLTCVVAVDINNGCRIAEHFKFKWGPDVEWKVFAILMAYSLAMLINISRPFISFNKLYLNLPQIQLLGGPQKLPKVQEKKKPQDTKPEGVKNVSTQPVQFWWMPSWWNKVDWIFHLSHVKTPTGRGSFYAPRPSRNAAYVSYLNSFDHFGANQSSVQERQDYSRSIPPTSTDFFASESSLSAGRSYQSTPPSLNPQISRSISSCLSSFSPSGEIGIGLSPINSTPASNIGAYSPGSSTPTWSPSERPNFELKPGGSPYSSPTGSNISAELSGLMALQDRAQLAPGLWRDNIGGPQPFRSQSFLSPKSFSPISPPGAQSSPYDRQNQNWLRLRRAKSESPFLSPGANVLRDYSLDSGEQLFKYLTEYEKRRAISRSVAPGWNTTQQISAERSYLGVGNRSEYANDHSTSPASFSGVHSGSVNAPSLPIKLQSRYQISTGLAPVIPTHKRSGSGGSTKSVKGGGTAEESFISLGNSSSVNLSLTFWSQFDIDPVKLECFTQNLRLWISRTILKPVMEEIDKINRKLTVQNRADLLIGEASVPNLHSLVFSAMGNQFPNLSSLLTYLDFTPHQAYLIGRLRELSADGCMCDFQYKGGGPFKGRKWEEHLPSDPQIILHLLCVYLDSKCPPNPLYPDGRTFSGQFVIVPPTKRLESNRGPCLEQQTANPPHFRFVLDGELYDPGPGRNNFFQVLAMLIRHFMVKNNGQMANVSLDTNGINIAWIFDE